MRKVGFHGGHNGSRTGEVAATHWSRQEDFGADGMQGIVAPFIPELTKRRWDWSARGCTCWQSMACAHAACTHDGRAQWGRQRPGLA